MIGPRSLLLSGLLFCACSKGTGGDKPPVSAPPAASAPASTPSAAATLVLDPAPPAGVVVPRAVKAGHAEAGTRNTSWKWRAVFEVDPARPEIQQKLATLRANRPNGAAADPGDAGVELYRDQVDAAGVSIEGGLVSESEFSYGIAGGLVVMVRSSEEQAPNELEVLVGIAGG